MQKTQMHVRHLRVSKTNSLCRVYPTCRMDAVVLQRFYVSPPRDVAQNIGGWPLLGPALTRGEGKGTGGARLSGLCFAMSANGSFACYQLNMLSVAPLQQRSDVEKTVRYSTCT